MITRLTVPITAVLALVVLVGCSESPRPSVNAPHEQSGTETSATPTSVPSPSPTTTVEPAASSHDETLPPFVQILSPQYQAAYRLLPDGPWAKEYIARQIQEIDLDEWRQMDSDDGVDVETTRELSAGKEFELRSMLEDAERDAEVEKWLVERVESLDADIGRQIESRKSVSDRTELFRTLVEDEGLYIDLELIMLEWEERKLGFSDEQIAKIAEDFRDMYETSAVYWSLGSKAGTVHSLEIDICRLLMEVVAGEHPRSVITDGNCEIDKAIKIAQENLAANDGQFARTEEDFHHWIEFADSVESGEHDANREEYVNPNPDDDGDDNYDG